MWRTVVQATLRAVVLLAVSVTAAGDIDLEIVNRTRVRGTLDDARFRARIPAGALLNVTVAAPLGGALMSVRLSDPSGSSVLWKRVTEATHLRVRDFLIEQTGEHEFIVSAISSRSYLPDFFFRATWRIPRSTVIVGDVGPGNSVATEFACDAGSVVIVKVKPGRHSKARPRIVVIEEVGGDVSFPVPPPDADARRHRVRVDIERTSRYRVIVSSDVAGTIVGTVRVKPRRKRTRLRVTQSMLGVHSGIDVFSARSSVIGPEGGTATFTSANGRELLEGATICVPAGALRRPVPVLIAGSTDVPPPNDRRPAGPSITCGSAGVRLHAPATVSMPFDPLGFDDQFNGIEVAWRSARSGKVRLLSGPVRVDAETQRVSFEISRFGSFRVVGPKLPRAARRDVTGDGIADLVVPVSATDAGAALLVFPGGAEFFESADLESENAMARLHQDARPSEPFGRDFATGDVNADGIEDIVTLNGPRDEAYVFFGGPTLADREAQNADIVITLGLGGGAQALAVGDATGNGIADILVAGPGNVRVRLFAGRVAFASGGPRVLDARDRATRTIVERILEEPPVTLALGDLTGDGHTDILVADPFQAKGGIVVIYPGGPSLVSRGLPFHGPSPFVRGRTSRFDLGHAVAVGDLNGDGFLDLAAGAPREGEFLGIVLVYLGPILPSEARFTPDRSYGSGIEMPGDGFGSSVAIFDLDGDGADDLLTGAPRASWAGRAGAGQLVVFFGIGKRGQLPPRAEAIDAPLRIHGQGAGDALGALLPALDLDGDGKRDLVIAAPFYAAENGSDQGRVYIFRGGTRQLGDVDASAADTRLTGRAGERIGLFQNVHTDE